MIRRIWHGWTDPADADAYEALLLREIAPTIGDRGIPGCLGMEVLRRNLLDETEFVTVMRFESMEAVRAFAGDDPEMAVVPAAAQALLRRFDQRSAHFELRAAYRWQLER